MAEIAAGEYIDAWVNIPDVERNPDPDPNVVRWFATSSPDILGGVTPAQMFDKMHSSGVQIGLLSKLYGMPRDNPHVGGIDGLSLANMREICSDIADVCRDHPGRLYGTTLIDPTQGMDAVRAVDVAVREFGFKAVRLFGAQTNIPPNHPLCYPIYVKAIELGVPVTVNVGMPGPMRSSKSQRPMDLEDVLLSFPELTVVMTHVGHPWYLETIALLQKFSRCYLMTSGWAPKHLPAELIHFMNTRGREKVMWSADYPLQTFDRCVREAHELPLRDGVLRRYMRENALEVFKLD